ncbi:MAG: glycosyltransferase family 39 protein [Croceitalea sp.]|nr:glycosyltransferase family 39 protein [Croceitalea sp.]
MVLLFLNKMLQGATRFYGTLHGWGIFTALLILSFLVRFPFFFRDYIDRDESTFILVAQSWVDGHLPYTQLWDLKPPITFLMFAIIIYLFGKSFIAIRLMGVILVAITAFFSYKIGMRLYNKKVGFLSAVALVYLQSLFGSLQGVMSEHICVAFFTIALYLLLFNKDKRFFFISGVLFGLAIMTKLNIAYAVLFLFFYLFLKSLKEKNAQKMIIKLFIIGMALVLVIFATAIPYYLQGELQLWWQSVFEAAMAYSTADEGSVIKVIPIVFFVMGLLLWAYKKKWLDYDSAQIQLLFVTIVGVLFSYLQTGKANGHYLIQLYPPLVILMGIMLSNLKLKKIKIKYPVIILLLLFPLESYLETYNVIQNKLSKNNFFNGEGIDVPNYFKANNLPTDNILFLEYHIGYWLLDEKPLTKAATHPSSILRDELYPYMNHKRTNSAEELTFLFEDIKPSYVITRKNRRIFDKAKYAANLYTNLQLIRHYKPLDTIDNAIIYERLELK